MATESEQKLAEAVRKYPVLYDKQDKYFKDRNKKKLAWDDVAKEANVKNAEDAEKAFRNLRTKYGKQKKKYNKVNKSGAGAKDVQRPALLDSLGWLEPFIVERETSSNWQPTSETLNVEVNDDEDETQDDGEEENDDLFPIIANPPVSPSSLGQEKRSPRISAVTGRQQFQKSGNKRKSEKDEADLMIKLKDRLSAKKDDDSMYGDLLASKLRKLTRIKNLKAKHKIDNLMFEFQIADEENALRNTAYGNIQMNQQLNLANSNKT